MPWLTILQVALLIAWYTALPTLPAWLVFLPLIIGASTLVIGVVFVAIGTIFSFAASK